MYIAVCLSAPYVFSISSLIRSVHIPLHILSTCHPHDSNPSTITAPGHPNLVKHWVQLQSSNERAREMRQSRRSLPDERALLSPIAQISRPTVPYVQALNLDAIPGRAHASRPLRPNVTSIMAKDRVDGIQGQAPVYGQAHLDMTSKTAMTIWALGGTLDSTTHPTLTDCHTRHHRQSRRRCKSCSGHLLLQIHTPETTMQTWI